MRHDVCAPEVQGRQKGLTEDRECKDEQDLKEHYGWSHSCRSDLNKNYAVLEEHQKQGPL